MGLIGIYREIFPKNINRRIKFKNKSESNENHAKRLTPRTSTNPLIQNMSPELFQKSQNSDKILKSHQKSLKGSKDIVGRGWGQGGRQHRDKGTRNIGSGLFGTFGTHIKDCGVLISK